MWTVLQPVLFGLTGATIRTDMLDGRLIKMAYLILAFCVSKIFRAFSTLAGQTVGLGIAVLSLGLISRLSVGTSVTWGLNFNLREKMFVSIAWIPKGTVQV